MADSERKINRAVSFEGGKYFTNENREEFDKHLKSMKAADRNATIQRLTNEGVISGYKKIDEESLSDDPTIRAGQKVPARSAGHEGEINLDEDDDEDAPAPGGQQPPVHREAPPPEGAPKNYGHEGEKGRGTKRER
jgi:hypothetical protein